MTFALCVESYCHILVSRFFLRPPITVWQTVPRFLYVNKSFGELEGHKNNINIMELIPILLYQYQSPGEAFFVGAISWLFVAGMIRLIRKIHRSNDEKKDFDYVSPEETIRITKENDKPTQTDSQKKESHDNPSEELGEGAALFVFVIVVIIAAIIGALNV